MSALAEWRAGWAIARQAVLERRAAGSLALSWLLLMLAALGSLVLLSSTPYRWSLFCFCTGVPLGMLSMMWWIYLCGNLRAQCTTRPAQLVPALLPRARRVMIVAWAVIVLVVTLLLGWPSGHPLLVAAITGLVLIEAGVLGTPLRFGLIGGAIMLLTNFGSDAARQLAVQALLSPVTALLAALLLCWQGRTALRRQFADPRRSQAYHVAKLAAPPMVVPAARGRLQRWLFDRPRHQPAFLDTLGPGGFGNHRPAALLLLVVCVALALAAQQGWLGSAGVRRTRALVVLVCLLWQGLPVWVEAARFRRARGEQALLSLSALAPPATAMNAVLARYWLGQFGRRWLITSVAMLGAAAMLGATLDELGRLAAVATCALPLAACLLADQGRAGDGNSARLLVAVAYAALAYCASGTAVLDLPWLVQWPAVALVLTCASVIMVAWRWQLLLRAAPMLPRGRFSGARALPAPPRAARPAAH